MDRPTEGDIFFFKYATFSKEYSLVFDRLILSTLILIYSDRPSLLDPRILVEIVSCVAMADDCGTVIFNLYKVGRCGLFIKLMFD